MMWWLAVWGCATPTEPIPGIQIGEEGDELPCRVVSEAVRDLDVPSGDLSFTPRSFLDRLPAEVRGMFTFDDGSSARVVSRIEATSGVLWSRHEPWYAEAQSMCDAEWYAVGVHWWLDAPPLALWTSTTAEARADSGAFVFVRVPGEAARPLRPDFDAPQLVLALAAQGTEAGWEGSATWEGFDDQGLVDVATLGAWVADEAGVTP